MNKTALTSSLLYQTGKISSEAFVLTGPVIGMVTDTTARVLIETNVTCTVECKLKTSDRTSEVSRFIHITRRVPKCFVFDGLMPETYYRVCLNIPCPGLVKSGFMTMPEKWSLMRSPARMAFVTTNNYSHTRDCVTEKVDLWRSLFKMANKGQIDYLVHMGNNVFIDSDKPVSDETRWQAAMTELDGVDPENWTDHYENVCEIFRGAYRETWNHPMTKHVLANVPNLMILNDLDIRASFGDRADDYDPYTQAYFLCCCAYEIYNQYQRNLFENYEAQASPYSCTSEIRQAYHFHVFGDIGIMFLDLRAAHTLHKSLSKNVEREELPLLGYRQWKGVEFALSEHGYFSGCRMLFVVTPTPPAIVGETGMKLFQMCGGVEIPKVGAWHSEPSISETSYLLSLLFDWRAKQPGQQEFCIITSGMGQGFMTDIVDARYTKICDVRLDRAKQIALGPISNGPALPHNKKLLGQAIGQINAISPYHQFKHYNVSNDRQFAVVDVYLQYNNLYPDNGMVTNFTAQITESDDTQMKTSVPISATFRIRGNFAGSFFSLCDPAKRLAPRLHLNEHFALMSTTSSESEALHYQPVDDRSVNGTYDNISMPLSLEMGTVEAKSIADASRSQGTRALRDVDQKRRTRESKVSAYSVASSYSTSSSRSSSSYSGSDTRGDEAVSRGDETNTTYTSLNTHRKEKKYCKVCGCEGTRR